MIKLNKLGILCMTLVLLIMFTNKASATSDISPASLNYFVEKLDIEVFKQEKDYYCGPANIKMVVQYLESSSESQSVYANYMGTDDAGESNAYDMWRSLNHYTSRSWTESWYSEYSTSSFANLVKNNIDDNKPLILNARTKTLYMYNGVNLGHYITISGYTYTASFGDSPWYGYFYYVDPYDRNYGLGTNLGEHQDTASNVFGTLNHRYGVVIH